jgi:hypothetical protein
MVLLTASGENMVCAAVMSCCKYGESTFSATP